MKSHGYEYDELTLSTHEEGKMKSWAKRRFLKVVVISFIILVLGIVLFYFRFDSFLPIALLISIYVVLLIYYGYRYLIPTTLELDKRGIRLKRGDTKKFEAHWSDIDEAIAIPTPAGFYSIYRTSQERSTLKVRSKGDSFKLTERIFDERKLKHAFQFIAEKAMRYDARVVDDLHWLPESLESKLETTAGKEVEHTLERKYNMVIYFGIGLMAVGGVLFLLPISGEIDMVGGMLGLFIGLFSVIIALSGKSQEKKKSKGGSIDWDENEEWKG